MSAKIEDLEPVTRGLCEAFLKDAAAVTPGVRITQTMRTPDEQLHLWAQGRRLVNGEWKVTDPHLIVTKAMPGSSAHNYGAAFDVCFNGPDPYLHAYEEEHDEPDPRWLDVGRIGENVGLNWGGPNGKGDRFTFDRPHFERPDWRSLRSPKEG